MKPFFFFLKKYRKKKIAIPEKTVRYKAKKSPKGFIRRICKKLNARAKIIIIFLMEDFSFVM
jgi:hypothetical protein